MGASVVNKDRMKNHLDILEPIAVTMNVYSHLGRDRLLLDFNYLKICYNKLFFLLVSLEITLHCLNAQKIFFGFTYLNHVLIPF